MRFQVAAEIQRRNHTYYVVYLVSPGGERQRLGFTQQKTGIGLMRKLASGRVQEILAAIPSMAEATFRKFADRLELSNGYKVVFGDTLRREADDL